MRIPRLHLVNVAAKKAERARGRQGIEINARIAVLQRNNSCVTICARAGIEPVRPGSSFANLQLINSKAREIIEDSHGIREKGPFD
jgi:hypothetical protein